MKKCEKCGKQHGGLYATGRFCSISCARSYAALTNREETNKKVSKALKGRRTGPHNPEGIDHVEKICPVCLVKYQTSWSLRNRKTCSRTCGSKWPYHRNNPDREQNIQRARKGGRKSAQVQKETRRSKNEISFAEMCKKYFKKVLCNEPMFNKWDADVILPEYKIAILWNGPWHSRKLFEGHNIKQVRSRDKIKLKAIKQCGYRPYIINDPDRENYGFVKSEFEKFEAWLVNEVQVPPGGPNSRI